MMRSQILKSVDFRKIQKSRYLENDIFFLHIKEFINYISRATLWQKRFEEEVTFQKNTEKLGTFNIFLKCALYFQNFTCNDFSIVL